MTERIGTHWENCETAHHDCALVKLERARAELDRMRPVVEATVEVDRLSGDAKATWAQFSEAKKRQVAAVATYRKGEGDADK